MSTLLVALCLVTVSTPAPRLEDRPLTDLRFPAVVGCKKVFACRHGIDEYEMIVEAVKVEKWDGGTLVTCEREIDRVRTPDSKFVVSPNGLLVLESQGRKLEAPMWHIKLPAKGGLTWDLPPAFGDGKRDPIVRYIVRGQEEIEVPAGKFVALRMEIVFVGDKSEPTIFWYAPGVGIVKRLGEGEPTMVLKSFTLPK